MMRDLIKRMGVPLGARDIGRSAIPPAETAPPQYAPVSFAPEPPRQRFCLIVDDSRVVRKVSRQIVESLGYLVIEAENGEEALSRCHADMPDLVLLDWDMPVMTGIQFIAKLRAIATARPPKAVFCTSKSESIDVFRAIEAGADEYVTKPFNEASLKAKLERIGAL